MISLPTCHSVFTDWLDVTSPPDSSRTARVGLFLQSMDCSLVSSQAGVTSYQCGEGVVRVEQRSTWGRVSASGAALAHMRAVSMFLEYLSELSQGAHRVSRVDVALDLPVDGADSISEFRTTFSGGFAALSRKALPVSWMLENRPSDGRETGTMYLGHRCKARVTARMYDKAHEALRKRGEHVGPRTRYEITVRGESGREGPTLRDAAEPTVLFWHYASPTLLQAPVGLSEWIPRSGEGWTYSRPDYLPADVLQRRVESSADLGGLIDLADSLGPHGRRHLLYLVSRRLGVNFPSEVQ